MGGGGTEVKGGCWVEGGVERWRMGRIGGGGWRVVQHGYGKVEDQRIMGGGMAHACIYIYLYIYIYIYICMYISI